MITFRLIVSPVVHMTSFQIHIILALLVFPGVESNRLVIELNRTNQTKPTLWSDWFHLQSNTIEPNNMCENSISEPTRTHSNAIQRRPFFAVTMPSNLIELNRT